MFDVVFGCDLEDANSPVDLGLFANGKPVGVDEAGVDVLEGGVQGGFCVAGWRGDEGDIGQGGEGACRGRG